jgi:hypothetical protein
MDAGSHEDGFPGEAVVYDDTCGVGLHEVVKDVTVEDAADVVIRVTSHAAEGPPHVEQSGRAIAFTMIADCRCQFDCPGGTMPTCRSH